MMRHVPTGLDLFTDASTLAFRFDYMRVAEFAKIHALPVNL